MAGVLCALRFLLTACSRLLLLPLPLPLLLLRYYC